MRSTLEVTRQISRPPPLLGNGALSGAGTSISGTAFTACKAGFAGDTGKLWNKHPRHPVDNPRLCWWHLTTELLSMLQSLTDQFQRMPGFLQQLLVARRLLHRKCEKNADFGGFSAWDSSPRSKPPPSHGPNWWDPSLSDSKGSLEPTLRQSASIHPGFRLRLHPGESVFTGRTYVFQPLKALASSELSFCRASSRDVWRIRFLLRLLPVHLPGSLLSSGWALIKLDSRFCIFRLRVLMIEISLNFIRASRTESYLKCRAFCNSKSPSCCKGRLT